MTRTFAVLSLSFAALVPTLLTAPAAAQDIPQITVRPRGGGDITAPDYVGPYGRELPGVAMFSSRAVPVTPDISDGDVPLPTNTKIINVYTFNDPLPVLDGWHGTLEGGIPFNPYP